MGEQKRSVEGLVMDKSFWKGKKVLLTGHTGFKGSWMSLWLNELGAEVSGFSLVPETSPSMFILADIEQKMKSHHIGDIRNIDAIKTVVKECNPEIIIHMAAQPLVLRSYDDPVESYMTNVIGTANVFEAARECSELKAIVNITTDKCYENKEWYWGYRENEAFGGHDPYSSSKACAELVTTTYRKCFFSQQGVQLASVRAGNVIGGGDWADNRLIPDLLRSIANGKPVVIRSPKAIRPWQHVLEPIAGYLKLAEKLCTQKGSDFAEGWNFGPYDNDAKPVEWILERLCEKWGDNASWQLDDPNKIQLHEANYLKLDCSKARKELQWEPQLGLDSALDWIVEWYRAYTQGSNVYDITLSQIQKYQELCLK